MKVDVLIERDIAGRLHAYVQQRRGDGHVERGDDMLTKYVIRDVTLAKMECSRILQEMFKLPLVSLDGISYTYPEDWKP